MKLFKVHVGSVIVLLVLAENVISTILTGTLLTGFMGGFLMGKITLGTFLAIMSTANQPQKPATAANPAAVAGSTRYENKFSGALMDIPDSVETEVRDRLLRQLGKMDPLNCLPKVFCEISADPKSAPNFFGVDGINFGKTMNLNKLNVTSQKRKNKKGHNKDKEQSDATGHDDDDSDSESNEEDDDAYDEEESKLKEYKAKEAYKLETKALDEMIDEFDDPINYYYILKDKKKSIHPELKGMLQNADLSSRSFAKIFSTAITKRVGESVDNAAGEKKNSETPPGQTKQRAGESTIDDIFADDPFFDDFSRSLKFEADKTRLANIAVLRRSRRNVFNEDDEDITLSKYKMAAKIAETYKDPKKCRRVFDTCPFSSEEVMNMITKLNSEDQDNKSKYTYTVKTKNSKNKVKKDDSLKNLKNTLLAIEKLNDATLLAETTGEPIDYKKVVQDASKSKSQASGASAKIMEDFEQIEDNLTLEKQEISKRLNRKSKKSKKKSAALKIRQRRNGGVPPPPSVDLDKVSTPQNRRARISVKDNTDKLKSPAAILTFRGGKSSIQVGSNSEEDSATSNSDESHPEVVSDIFGSASLSVIEQARVAESRRVFKPEDEVEDDEVNSPESNEHVKVPTFSQTFIDTVQSPSKIRTRPRPIHPIVKVKPQYLLRSTTPKAVTNSITSKPRRTTKAPLIAQHFSGEAEDDEDEATHSEKNIDALVSKYKPKDKKKGTHV